MQQAELPGANIPWLEALREKGRRAFAAQGMPTAKTEAWKYTRPRDLQTDDFVIRTTDNDKKCCGEAGHCSCEKQEEQSLPFECYEICFENGCLQHNHLHLPRGVTVMPLMEAITENDEIKAYLGKSVDIEHYPFAALNTAYLAGGLFIRIAGNTKLDKPLAVLNRTHSCHENLFCNLRNIIVLESGAEAELIESFTYDGAEKSRYFNNIVNEIYIGRKASLRHCKFQNEAFKAVHVSLSQVKVREGGNYESFCLQRGANLARNETKVLLTEEQARAEVNAAYIMNGWATIDTTTDIEHLSPQTYSDQLVRGIVGGNAKGVFQGKIHIAPEAVKTEGTQQHKALLLTDTAEVDCKPELEIFADDVKCSHGAASGELDEEQLFYLRSRGIGEDEARQILIDAYLEDVFARIRSEKIKDWLVSLSG